MTATLRKWDVETFDCLSLETFHNKACDFLYTTVISMSLPLREAILYIERNHKDPQRTSSSLTVQLTPKPVERDMKDVSVRKSEWLWDLKKKKDISEDELLLFCIESPNDNSNNNNLKMIHQSFLKHTVGTKM